MSLSRLKEARAQQRVPPTVEALRQSRAAGQTLQRRLRASCRAELDIVVLPVFPSRGDSVRQVALSTDELSAAHTRRWRHMTGRKEVLAWAIQRAERLALDGGLSPSAHQAWTTPRRGVAFWHGSARLPLSVVDGLGTAVRVAQLRVELFCYIELPNVPADVEVPNGLVHIVQLFPRGLFLCALFPQVASATFGSACPVGGSSGWPPSETRASLEMGTEQNSAPSATRNMFVARGLRPP